MNIFHRATPHNSVKTCGMITCSLHSHHDMALPAVALDVPQPLDILRDLTALYEAMGA